MERLHSHRTVMRISHMTRVGASFNQLDPGCLTLSTATTYISLTRKTKEKVPTGKKKKKKNTDRQTTHTCSAIKIQLCSVGHTLYTCSGMKSRLNLHVYADQGQVLDHSSITTHDLVVKRKIFAFVMHFGATVSVISNLDYSYLKVSCCHMYTLSALGETVIL